MGGKKADMVFADPSYNVKINGHVCGTGSVKHDELKFASSEMASAQFTHFLRMAFERLCAFRKSGSLHYICMDWRHIKEIIQAGKESV